MASTGRQCKALRKDGGACQAWPVAGSEFCLSHDPQRATQIAAARQAGGRARHGRRGIAAGAEQDAVIAPGDVLRVLAAELQAVRSVLEVSNARAGAVARLALAWAALFEGSELERRVSVLEGAQHENN